MPEQKNTYFVLLKADEKDKEDKIVEYEGEKYIVSLEMPFTKKEIIKYLLSFRRKTNAIFAKGEKADKATINEIMEYSDGQFKGSSYFDEFDEDEEKHLNHYGIYTYLDSLRNGVKPPRKILEHLMECYESCDDIVEEIRRELKIVKQ